MKSFRDSNGFTRAVAVERADASASEDDAEVIDLVQLPAGTRPTPFASLEYDEVSRCRVMDCGTYSQCLAFAARLQWPSFHCRSCPRYGVSCGALPSAEANDATARRAAAGPGAAVIKLR